MKEIIFVSNTGKQENMEKDIIELDDYRPHLVLKTLDGNIHCMPISLLEDWVSGKQDFHNTDEYEIIIRSIVDDYLRNL